MKTIEERVWESLRDHGGYSSSVETAVQTGIIMPNVSAALTQLARKGLAEMRRDVEFSGDTARRKTVRRYKAVGAKYIRHPVMRLVPANQTHTKMTAYGPVTPLVIANEPKAPDQQAENTNDYAEFLEYRAFQKFMAMKKQFTG